MGLPIVGWLGGIVLASIAGSFVVVRIAEAVVGSFLDMDFRKLLKP